MLAKAGGVLRPGVCAAAGAVVFRARISRPGLGKGKNSGGLALAEKAQRAMANILVNLEKGIVVAAEDLLKLFGKADTVINAAPAVVAALATLATAVERPLVELSGAAANPLNIALDVQTAMDLKAVWPDVKTFLGTLGVKF